MLHLKLILRDIALDDFTPAIHTFCLSITLLEVLMTLTIHLNYFLCYENT